MAIPPFDKKIVRQRLTTLSPAAKKCYQRVQKRTRRLQKHNGEDYVRIPDAVDKLLIDGRLESSLDAEGESLIKNLADLCDDREIPRSHQNDVIGWTVTHLAYPSQSFTQVKGVGTCAPTVLAYDLAEEKPAEFVRLVNGLASKDRQVTLADGQVMERAVGSIEGRLSSGTPVARMLQGSFMNFAGPGEEYRIQEGKFEDSEETGLAADFVEKLFEAVENRELDIRTSFSAEEMRVALATVDDSLPVVVRWTKEKKDGEITHAYHMVLVKAQDDQYVEFRNPWGKTADHALADSGREILDNGNERLPRKEFYERLNYAVVPQGWKMTRKQAADPSLVAPVPSGKPLPPQADEVESRPVAEKEAPAPIPSEREEEKGFWARVLDFFG